MNPIRLSIAAITVVLAVACGGVGNSPPVITAQPLPRTVVAPDPTTFTVFFEGTVPFGVQWQRSNDGGVTWANEGAQQSVATSPGTSNLFLAATSAAVAAAGGGNGALFRAAISNIETPVPAPVLSNAVALTVTATAPATATLTATVTPAGSGSVTSVPAGIDCGADCSEAFALNTSVTLTATPGAGFIFSEFSGDADCSDATVTMSVARACTATFTATGSLAIDAFEIAGPPARFEPPTQSGQFGSFTPAASATCSLHPTVPNLLQFAALSAAGTQSGSMTLNYDVSTRQVLSVGYNSNNPAHADPARRVEFRYLCQANSPAPGIRACTGVTVDETNKTIAFVDVVLDFEAPSFIVPSPSDIRMNGILTESICFP